MRGAQSWGLCRFGGSGQPERARLSLQPSKCHFHCRTDSTELPTGTESALKIAGCGIEIFDSYFPPWKLLTLVLVRAAERPGCTNPAGIWGFFSFLAVLLLPAAALCQLCHAEGMQGAGLCLQPGSPAEGALPSARIRRG